MTSNLKKLTLAISFGVAASSSALAITLEEFKKLVYEKNPTLEALDKNVEASNLKTRRGEELTTIRLFSAADFVDDTRYTASPAFQGSRSTFFNTGLGLRQQTPFGLQWSLSQNMSKTKIFGVSPALLPDAEYWDFYPKAEAKISLWKNLGGAEVRAQRNALSRLAEMGQLAARLDKIKKDIEVESAFYNYGIQKNIKSLSQLNLDRTQRLFRFVKGRRAQNLVDESDLLQVQAALAMRELEYDRAQRNLGLATRQFNNLLENEDQESAPEVTWKELVPEDLVKETESKKYSLAELMKQRDLQFKQAQSRADNEAISPQLDLYGGTTFQGRDKRASASAQDLNDNRKNVWNVGLGFQIPIDFGLVMDLKKSTRLEEESARARLKYQSLDQSLSWKNFQEELLKCSESLRLLSQLEQAQQKRFFSEDSKFKKGRSTLFQVLIAEQDFINAQTQKLGNELQCRVVKAQGSLFYNEGASL